ncbi:MAG: DinB family protein [Saprospiraceae bacterium]|nr:DinB family protein [Saprospiraceae bacterium]
MKRSELKVLPEYFDRYVLKCDDVEMLDALKNSIDEIEKLDLNELLLLGDKVYAPGKWTVKEVFQHLIDTERIFSYRVLCYARGEKEAVLGFDEDSYNKASMAQRRELKDLLDELIAVHRSTLALFQSFTTEMLDNMCIGFKGKYSVASAGFLLPGHQRWHLDIIKERYLTL